MKQEESFPLALDSPEFIAQGTLLNVPWQPDGRGVWGRVDTCIGMAESLQCSPERNTTLQQSIFQYIIKNLNT